MGGCSTDSTAFRLLQRRSANQHQTRVGGRIDLPPPTPPDTRVRVRRLLWEQPSYAKMNAFLHEWCDFAAQSAIRQMMQLAKTLLSHKSGILSWWKQRINNGRMEGINNKIKTLLRQTYGLRDERYFVLKLYSLHHSRQELLG